MKTYLGVEVQRYAFSSSALRGVIGFTPRPLYLQRKSPRYPLYKTLFGPQTRSRHSEEKKKIPSLALPGIETNHPSRNLKFPLG